MKPDVRRLLQKLQKSFGADVVVLGADLKIDGPRRPFGLKSLDDILDGGLPAGKIIEMYGPEHSGKTTLAYCAIARAQESGQTPAYIDAEGQWNIRWAKKQGIDPSNLLIARPVSAEAALELLVTLVRAQLPLVVLDSVGALAPLRTHKARMDERQIGIVPLLLNQAMRKILVLRSQTTVLLLNQLRERISIGRRPLVFAEPFITPGGRGFHHFAHIRLEVTRVRFLWQKKGQLRYRIGQQVAVQTTKSKVGTPFRRCELTLLYQKGFVHE
ncbi:MAG: DNA recombination/repair protein RecA [Candidatus Aenigmatarchaeota archaeon]